MLKDNARKWQLTKNRNLFFLQLGGLKTQDQNASWFDLWCGLPVLHLCSQSCSSQRVGTALHWEQWCWQLRLGKRTSHVLLWSNMRNFLVKTGQKTTCGKVAKIHRKKDILCGNVKESLCYYKRSSYRVCWAFTSSPSSSPYMRLASSHTTMGWVGRYISGHMHAYSLVHLWWWWWCVCAHVWVCLCLWMWACKWRLLANLEHQSSPSSLLETVSLVLCWIQ